MPLELTPMLATPSTNTVEEFERLIATGDWAADVKLDGVRCWVYWRDDKVTLLNRNGVNITAKYPDVMLELADHLAGEPACVVDGEIVARNGSFESTLSRDKQTHAAGIARTMALHPCTFYAFDLPTVTEEWTKRRDALEQMRVPTTVLSDEAGFFAQTRTLGLEGVIAKRRNGRYEFGRRSAHWLKFKNVCRVTCIAYAYTPGTGARAHFGAMQLALLDDDGKPVSVGRVGTGFTAKTIAELKGLLDAGTSLAVEIECLNVTSGNQLRFPSYKGIRTDVPLANCTMHQLDTLTRC